MRLSVENLLAIGVMGAAVAVMIPTVSGGPLVLDEHAAYWLSAPDSQLSITERSLRYAAAPPFACWSQSLSMRVFGETELALRLPSVMAYLAAILVMALGGRSTLGGIAAAFAAGALALHPDVVDEVRIGRTYGFVVLWTTTLLILTLRWQQREVHWRHVVLWTTAAAAATWTHILTIPVTGMSAVFLAAGDVRQTRSLRLLTLVAWGAATLLCLPLIPMIERIWEWRHALNYQTGTASLTSAMGPFLWLCLPMAAVLVLVISLFGRQKSTNDGRRTHGHVKWNVSFLTNLAVAVALGIVPFMVLAMAGRDDLASLANPRYRVPLGAANACLLGLLASRIRWTWAGLACLLLSLVSGWAATGRLPTELVRLGTPQAVVWQEMGQKLERVANSEGLEQAPVFVQSGLIEAVLIPAFPDDLEFHGYVSSRLGHFYARTPNPRYALPMFWGGDNQQLLQFFMTTLAESAGREPSDLFVAVATDTDVNRASYEQFDKLLHQFGYVETPLTGHEPWAILYHYRRKPSP